ncbi:uncharacterized protein LOC124170337 [Ischnura elegans]|uniref:uncharacterized protein LOC124170337 n=1 Tax=Ischnura elegans TaxID=197161 RepID=UPI001ED8B917|nr:uncharacterized protein LOC124170337 [Ischnura elegans]
MLYTSDPAAITSDASDPLAIDDLCHAKEESQDHLSEENYPVLYTSDPAGISNYISNPLATDELSGMGTNGSPSVKADQSSDDEGRDVHIDSTGGTTNELVPQPSDQAQASASSQWGEVDAEERGAIGIDLDSMLVLAKKESPKETDTTEPTFMENGELIQKQTMAMESMTEALGKCS